MTVDEFIEAIQSGQGEQAALQFVVYGGDVNAPMTSSGLTALHLAVEAENLPMIQALFNLGADLEARDANGWTPLHRAVDLDLDTASQTTGWGDGDFLRTLSFRTTQLLISFGADGAARSADGRTPRDIAAGYGESVLGKYDEAVEQAQRIT
jgi:ankyrin repeat protein